MMRINHRAIHRVMVWGTLGALLSGLWLALPAPLSAQESWQASYWNNATLTGEPTVTRQELRIDYNWGLSSPDPHIADDTFSARWTRTEQLAEGTYRFTATVDDGIRLWLNGVRILEDWQVGAERTRSVDVYLTAGTYETRVEYFEANGLATVTLERTLLTAAEAPATATPDAPIVVEDPALGTTTWRAAYYNNISLAGTPALIRGENNIDFRWGSSSPVPGQIDPNRFSARWTRTLDLDGGRYRFAVTADDGIRLYVNGRLLINEWHDQTATTYTVEQDLPGGATDVRIDYYENLDQATARFSYAKVLADDSTAAPPAAGLSRRANWRGEYYDNVNLSGEPLFARIDDAINFDWGTGSPAPNQLGSDRFSVRWSDTLNLTPGRYRFVVTADDGVRLRINGETVIDEFTVQSARSYTAERDLPDGRAVVVMEYFENTGVAIAQLGWQQVDAVAGSTDTTVGTTVAATAGTTVDESVAQNSGAFPATVIGAANVNARRGPGVEYAVVTVLARDQRVAVIGRNRTTAWVEIALGDGRTAWMNRRYLRSDNSYRTLPVTE
ncbi:MAG TPA: PA14 domain-containing protein [Caldilineaceae bacterium]|nr:PA14 domain-containing protein [Caldilineaceae bacterium]